MFKSVFTKTIYEKRWLMLFWCIGVVAMALLMMGFYHSFSGGSFDQTLKNLPKSVQGLVGNLASLKTVPGYVSQEVFALRIPMLTLIMGIVLFSDLLAGNEGSGTLQTLLAQPVSRSRVLLSKFFAGLFVSLVICLSSVIGVLLGLLMIHEHISLWHLVQSAVGVWLLTVLFGTIGFALGAITGKKGLSGSLAGLAAFSTYLLSSFVGSVSGIAAVEKLSPFHYYNHPSIAEFGLKTNYLIITISVVVVLLVVSIIVFRKRDIYPR